MGQRLGGGELETEREIKDDGMSMLSLAKPAPQPMTDTPAKNTQMVRLKRTSKKDTRGLISAMNVLRWLGSKSMVKMLTVIGPYDTTYHMDSRALTLVSRHTRD